MTEKDFMSRFKAQEEVFKKEKLPGSNLSWNYPKPTEYRAYEEWLMQVKDPVTKDFYKSHDDPPKEARMQIQTLVRVRLPDSKEKVYSIGSIIGYNSFGDELVTSAYRPEVREMTKFGHRTTLDKYNRLTHETTGPQKTVLEYDLDFTPENVDKLYKNRASDNAVTFVVKEEATGLDISVKGRNPKETYELFKNCSFDYLYNVEYKSNINKNLQLQEELKRAGPDPSPNTKTRFNEPEKVK